MLPRAPIELIFEPEPYREPLLSLRRPSRSILTRFAAHLLIRVLIVAPLPANLQAAAALFPVSILWPLVAPDEPAPTASGPENRVRGYQPENAPLAEGEASQAAEVHRGYAFGYGGSASDRLFNAKARFYDPTLGRFISQDSYLGELDDPPSLHRYFYGNANPTRYVDLTGHAGVEPKNLDYLINPQTGHLIAAAGSEEITVRAIPTLADVQALERTGRISRSEAIIRGVGANPVLQIPAEDPEFVKSTRRLSLEAGFKSLAREYTTSGQHLMIGMAEQDMGEFGLGMGETIGAAALPLVVKEGGGALVSKLTEKVPALATDVRVLAKQGLERVRNVLEPATEAGKRMLLSIEERLPFRWSADPSANLGNIKLKGGQAPVVQGNAAQASGSGAEAIDYPLKRPAGVTDAQWQKKMEALQAGAAQGRARVVHRPVRTGQAQRQARAEGRVALGDHADHGLDLQYGGEDTVGEIISTTPRVNTSVGAQGKGRLKYPDGTPIRRFVELEEKE